MRETAASSFAPCIVDDRAASERRIGEVNADADGRTTFEHAASERRISVSNDSGQTQIVDSNAASGRRTAGRKSSGEVRTTSSSCCVGNLSPSSGISRRVSTSLPASRKTTKNTKSAKEIALKKKDNARRPREKRRIASARKDARKLFISSRIDSLKKIAPSKRKNPPQLRVGAEHDANWLLQKPFKSRTAGGNYFYLFECNKSAVRRFKEMEIICLARL